MERPCPRRGPGGASRFRHVAVGGNGATADASLTSGANRRTASKGRRARAPSATNDAPRSHSRATQRRRADVEAAVAANELRSRGGSSTNARHVAAAAYTATTTTGKSGSWRLSDPEEWVPSDTELQRRRKKPRVSPPTVEAAQKLVFAIGPTRRDRTLNRKKLSKKEKARLKHERAAASRQHPHRTPTFRRGSSASVRKLLSLQLASDLNSDLAAFAQFVSLTPDERAFRQRVFRELHELIRGVFPTATVELYGSSSSGMETFRSDLDISVGNLDFSQVRHRDEREASASPQLDSDDEEEDEEVVNTAGYVVSDTDEASASESETDDAEATFSLNLSIPGRTSSAPQPLVAASTPTKSPWNPTLRRQKMRQLRALQQLLSQRRPQFQIKCLSKAKIPILMIVDNASGLSIDLGVNREAFRASDHGRTTTLVAELQRALGAPFFSTVVFLKEFLHQFDLDKPFTGGLGSYRLYMMVAYIFTTRFPTPVAANSKRPANKRKKHGPPTSSPPAPAAAGTVLLKFLEVFGNRQKRDFFSSRTELPVKLGALMDVVDFHAVFRLDDCVDKFAMAFDILSKKRQLACVVYEQTLEAERRECAKRVLRQIDQEEDAQRLQGDNGEGGDDQEDDASSSEEDECYL